MIAIYIFFHLSPIFREWLETEPFVWGFSKGFWLASCQGGIWSWGCSIHVVVLCQRLLCRDPWQKNNGVQGVVVAINPGDIFSCVIVDKNVSHDRNGPWLIGEKEGTYTTRIIGDYDHRKKTINQPWNGIGPWISFMAMSRCTQCVQHYSWPVGLALYHIPANMEQPRPYSPSIEARNEQIQYKTRSFVAEVFF